MYGKKMHAFLEKHNASIGDFVTLAKQNGKMYSGVIIPHTSEDGKETLVLKLKTGYNIGVDVAESDTLAVAKKKEQHVPKKEITTVHDPHKPTVLILHTGGTIASKVDYKTGGVSASFDVSDLLSLVPEVKEIANIQTKVVFQEMSENFTPSHWKMIADEIAKGCNDPSITGIVIGHGTDTLGYSSAALSFFLGKLNKPVVLVGAQRSSDRPSTDTHLNLISAVRVATSDIAEVVVVMHATSSDNYCNIIRGVKARKMHTSRRDAFHSINAPPIGTITKEGAMKVTLPYNKRSEEKVSLVATFEEKTYLLKVFPGQDPAIIDYLVDQGYKGIVLEGTGLGHVPVGERNNFLPHIEKAIRHGVAIVITSQTLYGRTHPFVYANLVKLSSRGCIFAEDMHAELAFVKLGWILGQKKKLEDVKTMMHHNYCHEISDTSEYREDVVC